MELKEIMDKKQSRLSLLKSDGQILTQQEQDEVDRALVEEGIEYKDVETVKKSLQIDAKTRRKSWIAVGIATLILVIFVFIGVVIYIDHLNKLKAVALEEAKKNEKKKTVDFEFRMELPRLMKHLEKLNQIALAHNNSRSHKYGFNASLEYVKSTLSIEAPSLEQTLQPFPIKMFEHRTPSTLSEIDSGRTTELQQNRDFIDMGGFTGKLSLVGSIKMVSGLGCKLSDYPSFSSSLRQDFALIKRGECSFAEKIDLAYKTGAAAVLIYNDGVGDRSGPFRGQFGTNVPVPVFSLSFVLGSLFVYKINNSMTNEVSLNMSVNTIEYTMEAFNLCAETIDSELDDTILVGSHLDSVDAGPGINDNGSGSATTLELAIQSAIHLKESKKKMKFCWWGGEELGLLGSTYYVSRLDSEEKALIKANVNLDMVASPNKFYGIYNGSMAHASIKNASQHITDLFTSFFKSRKIYYEMTEFDGRSDYGPFIANDTLIPAGGLFTGAEQLKSETQQIKVGGLTNAAFDPCYHQACDTIHNIDKEALINNAMASAFVLKKLIQ